MITQSSRHSELLKIWRKGGKRHHYMKERNPRHFKRIKIIFVNAIVSRFSCLFTLNGKFLQLKKYYRNNLFAEHMYLQIILKTANFSKNVNMSSDDASVFSNNEYSQPLTRIFIKSVDFEFHTEVHYFKIFTTRNVSIPCHGLRFTKRGKFSIEM